MQHQRGLRCSHSEGSLAPRTYRGCCCLSATSSIMWAQMSDAGTTIAQLSCSTSVLDLACRCFSVTFGPYNKGDVHEICLCMFGTAGTAAGLKMKTD